MVRIPDIYLNCTIHLYPSAVEAFDGEQAGGTGFFLAYKSDNQIGQAHFIHIYAVTNRHVINPHIGNSPIIRYNRLDGQADVIELDGNLWFEHPDGDDIAICPIDQKLFVSHIYDINSTEKKGLTFVSHRSLLTRDDIITLNIGPGDDVFSIGRFVNHEGKQRNLPTVRFGNIAQMPEEKILLDSGLRQEGFLVESRSVSGYSGSPVFVDIPAFSDRQDGKGLSSEYHRRLLGINCAHLPFMEMVTDKAGTQIEDYRIKGNSGMAVVIPAWKLEEMLSLDELAAARKKIEEVAQSEIEKGTTPDTDQA